MLLDAHAVFAPPIQIEVPEFLTTFFKISSVAKRLAACSDSAAKLSEYRDALKVRPPFGNAQACAVLTKII